MSGYTCPSCSERTGKMSKGVTQCKDCGTLWWTPFDQPKMGRNREDCFHCKGNTMVEVAATAEVTVSRCAKCNSTIVMPS